MIINRLSTSFTISVESISEIIIGFTIKSLPINFPENGEIKLFYKVGNISVEIPFSSWSLVSLDTGDYDLEISNYGFPSSGQLIIEIIAEQIKDVCYGDPIYSDTPYQLYLGNISNVPVEYTSREFSFKPMNEEIDYVTISSNSISLDFAKLNPDYDTYVLNYLTISPGVVPDPGSYYTIKENSTWQYIIDFTLSEIDQVGISQTLSNLEFAYVGDEVQIGDTIILNLPSAYFYSDNASNTETETSFEYYDFETDEFIPLAPESYIQHDTNLEITSPIHYLNYQMIPFKAISSRTSSASNVVKSNYPLFTLNSDYLWEGGEGEGGEGEV